MNSAQAFRQGPPAVLEGKQHVRWPPDRFYWALLHAPDSPARNGRFRQRLGFLFENVVPGLAIEDVHACYSRVPGGGSMYLACGIQRSVLREHITPAALTLSPQELPEFIQANVPDRRLIQPINLLVDGFEPAPIKALKRRWLIQGLLTIVLIAVMLIVGIENRRRGIQHRIDSLASESEQLLGQAIGAHSGPQPPALRLLAELRQLEQTRSQSAPEAGTENCAMILADLLAQWSNELRLQIESIAITPTSIAIRGQAPSMADAQALADAVGDFRVQGWRVQQPQSELQRDQVTLMLRLDRIAAPKGAPIG